MSRIVSKLIYGLFCQAPFLPFPLSNIFSFSKSSPPSLNHINYAVNAEVMPPPLNHINYAVNAEAKQKSHVTSNVSDEAAKVIYYILLLLIIAVIDVVNVEMQRFS